MQDNYQTERLLLTELTTAHVDFIFELVNTPLWIKFIGNRNINTAADSLAYIEKILNNKSIQYWIVKLKDGETPVGAITFIQRDYLDHPDIGFAFLPAYAKNGYAYEASLVVLDDAIKQAIHPYILATTIPENENSIRLLEKLGFHFTKEIMPEKEPLLLYSMTVNPA
jgi:[ribosomal protein S5]-alanine N-acetyltransferase